MQGWSDDESEDDWIAKRRKASAASGRVAKGRGFSTAKDPAENGLGASDPKGDVVDYELRQDYTRYMIDPEDNFSPHRQPWAEMDGCTWQFSGAWSFKPDDHESRESLTRRRGPLRAVAAWRVEHGKGGNFTVALISGPPGESRAWLAGGKGSGRCEEPFVLEFRLDAASKSWSFRFGRATSVRDWQPLPWSNAHRTSFWLAVLPGDDGKQHILAGLDEFPERRFFFAKARLQPTAVGFGPALGAKCKKESFYVRDIVVFGRASLLSPPFASRDHFVEVAGKSRDEALKLLAEAGLGERVVTALTPPKAEVTLLVCPSAEAAAAVAAGLEGAIAVLSSEWTWPPEAAEGASLKAVKDRSSSVRECWSRLSTETVRELALFEEHTERRTRHLEGVRIARASATRTILGSLRGAAPLPKPPEVRA